MPNNIFQSTPSAGEIILWSDLFGNRRKYGLEGKVLTLEQLERDFPAGPTSGDETLSAVKIVERLNKSYQVYGREVLKNDRFIMNELLAYLCIAECKQIVFGPPRFSDDNSIAEQVPLGGSRGYAVTCMNCNGFMETHYEAISNHPMKRY